MTPRRHIFRMLSRRPGAEWWMDGEADSADSAEPFHSLRGEAKKIKTALREKRFRLKEILLGEIMQFILCQPRRPEVGSRH